jgi:hypothetical protein
LTPLNHILRLEGLKFRRCAGIAASLRSGNFSAEMTSQYFEAHFLLAMFIGENCISGSMRDREKPEATPLPSAPHRRRGFAPRIPAAKCVPKVFIQNLCAHLQDDHLPHDQIA